MQALALEPVQQPTGQPQQQPGPDKQQQLAVPGVLRRAGVSESTSVLADLEEANVLQARADALRDAALRRANPVVAAAMARLRRSASSAQACPVLLAAAQPAGIFVPTGAGR